MSNQGWQVARIEDLRSNWETPVGGVVATAEEQEAILREHDPKALGRWQAFAARYPDSDRTSHAIRRHFGINSFGINAYRASAGSPLIVPHDEKDYGQEELHIVVAGRARFRCDGEEVELGAGELLYARPEVQREAVALETPTLLVVVGGSPGKPYAPPSWAPDWTPTEAEGSSATPPDG
ncbi:MAG: AraC family ligand binding domain-containing protein [Gaiellaceae bacterium]